MIKGIGVDIVDISRIERLIRKYNRHFLEKVYTPSEIEYCGAKGNPSIHYAGRWAAKEAFYKALPLSCQPNSTWHSIEIITSVDKGGPVISICSHLLRQFLEKERIAVHYVSISHERKYCMASVVLE